MTKASSLSAHERGWFKVPNEPCLHGYRGADGQTTWYFKGRLGGQMRSQHLDAVTITEAKREVRRLRGDAGRAAERIGDRRITVAEYAERFLEAQRQRIAHPDPKRRRSARSVALDAHQIEKFIVPALGSRKLVDVGVPEVRRFVAALFTLRKRDGQPYSSNTLRDVVRVASALFREAAKDGLVGRNPFRELSADERPSSERTRQPRYLDPSQVDALIDASGETFAPILTLCGWCGLRVSESLAVAWRDLDLEAGTLTVERQLGDDGSRVDLKTRQSHATVDLLPVVMTALKAHRRAQAAKGLQLIAPDALVFVTETGRPQNRRNVLRAVHRAGDRLGLNGDGRTPVTVHSLRHSFVTNAIGLGLTIPEAAMLARHDPATTAAVYANVAETQRRQAAAKLAAALAAD
jgi:integrase